MKKLTRYTCPFCGKKNWNTSECSEHSELWKDLLDALEDERNARHKSRANGETHWHDSITGYKDDQYTIKIGDE